MFYNDKMIAMSRFSEWLENAMFNHGGMKYRQINLARDLRLRPNTISDWLNNKKQPTDQEQIGKLAIHFGVTSRFIYGLLDKKPPEDLNDALEEVEALVYRLNHNGLTRLSKDLKDGKYGK